MSNAIFEIFSEELPATLQKKIALDYKQFAEKELKELKVGAKSGNIFVGITLNRLVLKLENVEINEAQLLDFIDKTLKDFSKNFPRTMCYPQLEVRWLRPIRCIFACIDDKVLSGKYYGLELKNGTYINKFDFVKCGGFDDYVKTLTKEQIDIDYNKRLEFVKREVDKVAKKQGQEYNNIKLIEEIAGMSEYCTEPMVSTLDARFNVLPFELIELVLRENQRYVVFRPNDKKEIKFLIFGDKITADKTKRENIVKGHRKVVNARLDDALYYWQLDKKEQEKCGGLDKYKAHLKSVLSSRTFIDDITWGDYLEKQEKFADNIIDNKDILDKTKQLIWDTKLDLATGVVAEFPELQGVIGGYYFDYRFNPYALDKNAVPFLKPEILYYYLIDRIVYIQTMYQQGKQPTGSGDKYKVKARMEDVISVILDKTCIDTIKEKLLQTFFSPKCLNKIIFKSVFDLYKKRYGKLLEEDFQKFDKKETKFVAICVKLLDCIDFPIYQPIQKWFNFSHDGLFMQNYKRLYGMVKNESFVDNDEIRNKVEKITNKQEFLSNDTFNILSMNIHKYIEFIDKNETPEFRKKVLKYLLVKYFEQNLPVEFLEIV